MSITSLASSTFTASSSGISTTTTSSMRSGNNSISGPVVIVHGLTGGQIGGIAAGVAVGFIILIVLGVMLFLYVLHRTAALHVNPAVVDREKTSINLGGDEAGISPRLMYPEDKNGGNSEVDGGRVNGDSEVVGGRVNGV
jgi:hypothetical protein